MGMVLRESDKFSASSLLWHCVHSPCERTRTPSALDALFHSHPSVYVRCVIIYNAKTAKSAKKDEHEDSNKSVHAKM